MGDYSNSYIKFMSDIIDSGTWSRLSSGARTLYPVLLKFSDQNFKQVWPSTSTLMRLTGFKTKKSVVSAKKDLIEAGLLKTIPGNGHTNSLYLFVFDYLGYRNIPQTDTPICPRGGEISPTEGGVIAGQGGRKLSSNHINITINNTQKTPFLNKAGNEKKVVPNLKDVFGEDVYQYSLGIAKSKNMENDYNYVLFLCKQREKAFGTINNKQKNTKNKLEIWNHFLQWASVNLTKSSFESVSLLNFKQDGNVVILSGEISVFSKQIIAKFFQGNYPDLIFIFDEVVNENRMA